MTMPYEKSPTASLAGLWPWLLLAWVLVIAMQAVSGAPELARRLGDTDDAMRLVEVRAFLDGQGWYDTSLARLQPPEGYVSHWSRLVDAGLAGLYLLARPFTGAAGAEWFMRLAWPLLWLGPALAGVGLIAAKLAGRRAALIAIAFAVVALPAQVQFQPGRIDHHNVQIALALLGLAAAVWQERPFAPMAGGLLCGLMLAIGLESLPFAILVAAAFVLPGIGDAAAWRRAGRFGFWLAVATFAGLAVTLPPQRWLEPLCDQIAVNSAGAVVAGGAALWFGAHMATAAATPSRRLVAVMAAAGLAALVFVAMEPACLGGPFALVDPAIRPIWLDRVGEARSIAASLEDNATGALAALVFPLLALGLGTYLLVRRDCAARLPLAIMVVALGIAVILMAAMIRTFSYAAWFAVPVAAAGVTGLWVTLGLARSWQKAVPVVLCSPLLVTVLAVMTVQAARLGESKVPRPSRSDACLASSSFAPLARLAPGRVAAATNLGAHILALTPHQVLSAPYHRLSRGIVTAHAILSSHPDDARNLARANGVDWVVVCAQYQPGGISEDVLAHSLWQALEDDNPPAWLRLEPTTADGPLKVYSVAD